MEICQLFVFSFSFFIWGCFESIQNDIYLVVLYSFSVHLCERNEPIGYIWRSWKYQWMGWMKYAGKIIGRGGASQVYKGQTQDGKLVAVKCLNQGGRQAEEELLTDIQITCSLSHVNIVTLLGYCVDTPHMILVYDYIAQGSLDDHLHGKAIARVKHTKKSSDHTLPP